MIRANVVEALDRPDDSSSILDSFLERVKDLASDYGVTVGQATITGGRDSKILWMSFSKGESNASL